MTEGGISGISGPEAGVGVGDSRLLPLTKPPEHNSPARLLLLEGRWDPVKKWMRK